MKDKNLFKQRIAVFLKMLSISFRLSYESSPAILIFRLFAMMISSLVPIINLLAIKKITDSLVVYNNSVLKTWLIILIITQILMNALSKLTNYLSTIHSDKLSLLVSKNIINKVNEIDISYFDDPKLFDEINNVTRDVNTIPNFIWILLSTLQVLIQFGVSAVILSKFGFVFPIIITLSCLPNFIIEKKFALKMYNWTRNSMNDVRRMNYSYQTLIGKEFAKDVRINSLAGYLKEKFVYQWNEWFKNKKEILDRQFITSFLTIFLPSITSLSFVIFLVYKIAYHEASIGDFSYYLGIATQLISYTFLLISNVANIIQQREKVEYYNDFIDWKPLVQYKIDGQEITEFSSLEFQNVSFKYPNTDKYVLENITFQINEGERIALIGKNGSGKSTIVKLILRLYKPTSGKILVNGVDIHEYNTLEYYRMFSTMLQDYINYAFTLKENIMSADVTRDCTDDRVIHACKVADIYDTVQKWDNKLDTYLTKIFDSDGVELSGGQWQKIALARFIYKEAKFYIMDEPSSSLDLESEDHIFKTVFQYIQNKTLVLISHRMNNVHNMDKIIVIDHGKIIEIGKHNELMKNNGIYYELYNLNLKNYIT